MTTYILNGFSFLMNQPDEGNIKYKYVSSCPGNYVHVKLKEAVV
ncbi:hypothetical protein [Methanobrevibacter sp. V74]|nr:hypothetical protein [Methanobrevibacter sp. V74]